MAFSSQQIPRPRYRTAALGSTSCPNLCLVLPWSLWKARSYAARLPP
jgi:hypothetical protein